MDEIPRDTRIMSRDDLKKNTSNDINIGLILLTKDWRVVGMNEDILRMVGPATGMIGENFIQYHPRKSQEKVRDILQELSEPREGEPNTMIVHLRGKVWMISMSPMTVLKQDNTTSWALTIMDVTEQTGASMNPLSGHTELKKLPIYENGVFHFLSADQVYLIEADGNYCKIFTAQKKFYLLMSLKAVLQKFATLDFFRVHKSFIANLKYIRTIDHSAGNRMVISFDNPAIPTVPVSRRIASALKKAIS